MTIRYIGQAAAGIQTEAEQSTYGVRIVEVEAITGLLLLKQNVSFRSKTNLFLSSAFCVKLEEWANRTDIKGKNNDQLSKFMG